MTGVSVVLAITVVAVVAYGAGRWHRALPLPRSGRSSEGDGPRAELERVGSAGASAGMGSYDGPGRYATKPGGTMVLGRLDKHTTVSHYEALATQVAHERQLARPAWCSPRADGRGVALRLVWSGGGTGVIDGRRG